MDIKSRKLSSVKIQSIIIYIITLLLFTGFIVATVDLIESSSRMTMMPTFLPEYNYLYSQDFQYDTQDKARILKDYIYDYKNEEEIKKGDFLKNSDVYKSDLDEMFYNYTSERDLYLEEENKYTDSKVFYSEEEMREMFAQDKKKELEKLREDHINRELSSFENAKRELKSIDSDEIKYFATNGKDKIFNTKDQSKESFKTMAVSILIDREGIEIENEQAFESLYPSIYPMMNNDLIQEPRYAENEYKIYMGYTEKYINTKLNDWNQGRKDWEKKIQLLALITFGLIISFIRLVFITGRVSDSDEVELEPIDKIYTDLNVILCFGTIGLWFGFMGGVFRSYNNNINLWSVNSFTVVTILLGAIGLSLVLSLVRHIKNGTIVKHALFYKVFKRIFDTMAGLYNSGSTAKKIIAVLIIYPLAISLTLLIFPITVGIAIWLALKKVNEFEKIKEGVKNIKDGDLDYKIQIDNNGEFKKLAQDINDIGQGLKNSVDNELKSQRHRNELITNVSHDIRTPLTSIITYVDLLKTEKDEDKRQEYISILDSKSERLKKLIDDLFEASKVSSGNIPVELSKINIVSLITQGIGELNDKIEEKNMEFIITNLKDEIYVMADGNLLWRAIENLLSNIFKYGLEDSRVYIDIQNDGDNVRMVMKNISAYRLNISEKELMERFKRGDESRTSEGSGLGLSIAESLIKIQKGKFFIEIDGDLFKTTMILPKQ